MENIFKECEAIVRDREIEYGDSKSMFNSIALVWTSILRAHITPRDVALMMAAMKILRESQRHKRDNIIDGINYLAFAEELADDG